MKKLTPKQQRFVDEYAVDLNASAAATRAGYKDGSIGRHLITKSHVSVAISKRLDERSERTKITADTVIQQIQEDRKAAIEAGQLSVAMRANELLGRHLGMFNDKITLEHKRCVEEMTNEELELIARGCSQRVVEAPKLQIELD